MSAYIQVLFVYVNKFFLKHQKKFVPVKNMRIFGKKMERLLSA